MLLTVVFVAFTCVVAIVAPGIQVRFVRMLNFSTVYDAAVNLKLLSATNPYCFLFYERGCCC